MSRNYFNPVEASVELTLSQAGLRFQGGIARDVQVPSLLHNLGMHETSLSEDFILHSRKLDIPIYIQCKASGGGRAQHGKNIQNRTKEQIARGLFYRCNTARKQIVLQSKMFKWIGILDGNWAVTSKQPLKYIHMLQLAGYDHFISADRLLTSSFVVKKNSKKSPGAIPDRCLRLRAVELIFVENNNRFTNGYFPIRFHLLWAVTFHSAN